MMNQNFSYYGNISEVPKETMEKKGVHVFMLDHHIQPLVEKHLKLFIKEINQLISNYKDDFQKTIKPLQQEIKFLKKKVNEKSSEKKNKK